MVRTGSLDLTGLDENMRRAVKAFSFVLRTYANPSGKGAVSAITESETQLRIESEFHRQIFEYTYYRATASMQLLCKVAEVFKDFVKHEAKQALERYYRGCFQPDIL